jgi:hypothetical protein
MEAAVQIAATGCLKKAAVNNALFSGTLSYAKTERQVRLGAVVQRWQHIGGSRPLPAGPRGRDSALYRKSGNRIDGGFAIFITTLG